MLSLTQLLHGSNPGDQWTLDSWVTLTPVYYSPSTATKRATTTKSTTRPTTTPTPDPDGRRVPQSIPETPLACTFPKTSDHGFHAGQQLTTTSISLNRYESFRYGFMEGCQINKMFSLSDMAGRWVFVWVQRILLGLFILLFLLSCQVRMIRESNDGGGEMTD